MTFEQCMAEAEREIIADRKVLTSRLLDEFRQRTWEKWFQLQFSLMSLGQSS